jgi:hypothetical protein
MLFTPNHARKHTFFVLKKKTHTHFFWHIENTHLRMNLVLIANMLIRL